MSDDLLFKKLNFKSRRGMKETTFIVKKFIDGFSSMNKQQKDELWLLLELNDQELFDLIFKKKDQFAERFPHLKNFAN
jgi:succinate dehydrogenase flavin-adding protein (antitoxin of CptAB toxin-antitoxin module)|tara:strand:+ start:585 stop:818 length:234 start_codon:yes stop_codon:yes gene_type:complete